MNPAIEDFKKQVVPRLPEFFYDVGAAKYLVKQSDGGNAREWVKLSDMQMNRVLASCGVRTTKAKDEDMPPSARILCDATMNSERTVHYSGSLAGYHEGLHRMGGTRILVVDSPRIIKPSPGNWDTIKAVVEGLLGGNDGVQLPYFYGWLKLSVIALRQGEMRGAPALAFCGPKDCGKTFLQNYLITDCLGGRSAKPYLFMSGGTTFNADLFGAEHLCMGDEDPSTDLRSRRKFGAFLKLFVAEEIQQLHAKGVDARTARPFWRVTLSLNDEPENVLVLPPIDKSLRDKLMLFDARPFSWPMPCTLPDEKAKFLQQFRSELPAFIHWLIHDYKIDDALLDRRFTISCYRSPRIMSYLTEVSPEFRLAELIRLCFLVEPDGTKASPDKKSYLNADIIRSAVDLEHGLTSEDSPVRFEARNLLGGGKIATYLRRLHDLFPKHVFKLRTSKERLWCIRRIDAMIDSFNTDIGAAEDQMDDGAYGDL